MILFYSLSKNVELIRYFYLLIKRDSSELYILIQPILNKLFGTGSK